MLVKSASYVISAAGPKQYPVDGLPEVAFAGRSNVGKSSLINRLTNRKALARTSGKPGKTQYLNFFLLNDAMYFVDFPGYGFARVSKEVKSQWGRMIEGYLKNRDLLRAVVHIIDIRHAPSQDDVLMHNWLREFNIPTIIVMTKADKIPRGKLQNHAKLIRQTLQPATETRAVIFSAETGQGKDELWEIIDRMISEEGHHE